MWKTVVISQVFGDKNDTEVINNLRKKPQNGVSNFYNKVFIG